MPLKSSGRDPDARVTVFRLRSDHAKAGGNRMSELPSVFHVIRYGMFLARNLAMDAFGQFLKARFFTRGFWERAGFLTAATKGRSIQKRPKARPSGEPSGSSIRVAPMTCRNPSDRWSRFPTVVRPMTSKATRPMHPGMGARGQNPRPPPRCPATGLVQAPIAGIPAASHGDFAWSLGTNPPGQRSGSLGASIGAQAVFSTSTATDLEMGPWRR
jgi:hypothetical protein